MQRIFSVGIICGLGIFLAANANAQSSSSDSLDYFLGDWHCGVQDADGVLDPDGFSTASTEKGRGDWYIAWILAFHDGTSDKKVATMRYDAARKQYVLFLQGEDGSYGMGSTPDWQDHALSFKGTLHEADGKDIEFTKTFTIQDDGKFSLGWQVSGSDAQPSLVCAK